MRYFFFIPVFLLLLPAVSYAAELRLEQQPSSVEAGDTFAVAAMVNTGTDIINAIEGSVHYPPTLSLADIRLSGSLIPLWVSAPAEKEKGTVSFAGILPGGYAGTGNMFTLEFTAAQKKGAAQISFGNDTKVYLDDGKGMTATLSLPALSILVGAPSGTPRTTLLAEDTLPPEPFMPIVSSGEPFGLVGPVLVFMVQDKNSGIARYDIARSYYQNADESSLSWRAVQSPYAFVAGDNTRYLYVRAIDRAGNARIAAVPPQSFSPIAFVLARRWTFILGIAGGVILLIWLFRRRR